MSLVRRWPLLAALLGACATDEQPAVDANELPDDGGGDDAADAAADAADAADCATESCNGEDDDCDGRSDEGLPDLTCGTGACAASAPACTNGSAGSCTPGQPGTEVCNNLDDDCDGTPDNPPMLACGMGICATMAPACVGGVDGTCTPGMPQLETCNNLDDNCNGTPDDLPPISCGMGQCAATAPACVGGAPGTCTPGMPQPETCNNLDDNCNGTPDDMPPLSCGVGQCASTAPACVGGAPGTCTPGTPILEICSNGLDEDCNGTDLTPVSNTTCPAWSQMTTGTTNGDNTCSGADYLPAVQNDCAAGDGAGNDSVFAFGSDGSPAQWTVRMTGPVGYDTLLHVHSSTGCGTSDQLACSDDFSGVNVSEVTVAGLPSGGGYYVVADSFGTTNNREFTLTLSGVSINHDTCATPAPIRGNGVFNGTTAGRANNYTAPAGCASAGTPSASPDIVYSIVARTNGTITASTSGSAFDTMLYVSTACGSATIACNDDFSGTTSRVTWSATAGTTYYLVVDGFNAVANGNYELTINGY